MIFLHEQSRYSKSTVQKNKLHREIIYVEVDGQIKKMEHRVLKLS
jgi:uncharacterized membrane protein (UPF0127 family)